MSATLGSNILTNGLVLHLDPANDKCYTSGTSLKNLINGTVGQLSGGVTIDNTEPRRCFLLNGTNGRIIQPSELSLTSNSFTISIWIKITSLPQIAGNQAMGIFSTDGRSIPNGSNIVFANSGLSFRFRANIANNEGQKLWIDGALADGLQPNVSVPRFAGFGIFLETNKWHNITVTYNNLTRYFLSYYNGVLISTNKYFGNSNATNMTISQEVVTNWSYHFGFAGDGFLPGKLSTMLMYNRVLSATEVTQNYNALKIAHEFDAVQVIKNTIPGLTCALDPNNLRSWSGAGSALKDLSGNGYDFPATSSDFATYATSTVLRLDGSLARRAITGLNITLPYTILGVSRYNGLGVNRRARTISSNSNNWLMNHWKNTKARYFAEGWITADTELNNANNNLQIGVVTGATGDYHAYFDGTTDSAITPTAGTAAPGGIAFGGWGEYNESSNCDIGLFLVWNRVLTSTEIQTVYELIRKRFDQT